jgi:hypothetical protein
VCFCGVVVELFVLFKSRGGVTLKSANRKRVARELGTGRTHGARSSIPAEGRW